MQNVIKSRIYQVDIEVTSHPWRKPFVKLFETLFRAGDAIELGKTTLYVKDNKGSIIHQEYYGKSRKKAWYRKLEIERMVESFSNEDEFKIWLKRGNACSEQI
ncbi:hypothetical protein [Bacillus sp. FJAT-45350]|uniref:hypothetical protein n=1 Tax=Bacillus sp. FJAT-45350 TaxID=2011014 RepID=UPI000BB6D26A|nr:hypothetical protein [Bacillus sp. FJAT-45350]